MTLQVINGHHSGCCKVLRGHRPARVHEPERVLDLLRGHVHHLSSNNGQLLRITRLEVMHRLTLDRLQPRPWIFILIQFGSIRSTDHFHYQIRGGKDETQEGDHGPGRSTSTRRRARESVSEGRLCVCRSHIESLFKQRRRGVCFAQVQRVEDSAINKGINWDYYLLQSQRKTIAVR